MRATLANTYPQNEADERQKKVHQDSIADAEMVPAPPKTKLTEVTTNSARNKMPPEDPTSCPIRKKPITIVFSPKGLKIDRPGGLFAELGIPRPVSIDWRETLIPKPIEQQKTVSTFRMK
jgi:hypothetical protein